MAAKDLAVAEAQAAGLEEGLEEGVLAGEGRAVVEGVAVVEEATEVAAGGWEVAVGHQGKGAEAALVAELSPVTDCIQLETRATQYAPYASTTSYLPFAVRMHVLLAMNVVFPQRARCRPAAACSGA